MLIDLAAVIKESFDQAYSCDFLGFWLTSRHCLCCWIRLGRVFLSSARESW